MPLDPEVQAFAHLLREIEQLVRQTDGPGWADTMAQAAAEVERSDAHGVQSFLGTLGGMGSLNDLVLMRDGKVLTEENRRFDVLITKASELGRKLSREADAAGSAPIPDASLVTAEAAGRPQPISTSVYAYLLIGFAVPLTLVCFFIADFAFLPRRHGPPLIPFQLDQPLVVIWLIMTAVALGLWGGAALMLRGGRRPSTTTGGAA